MDQNKQDADALAAMAKERDKRFAALDAFLARLEGLSDQSRMIAALEAVMEVIATSVARKADALEAADFVRRQIMSGVENLYANHDDVSTPRKRAGTRSKTATTH